MFLFRSRNLAHTIDKIQSHGKHVEDACFFSLSSGFINNLLFFFCWKSGKWTRDTAKRAGLEIMGSCGIIGAVRVSIESEKPHTLNSVGGLWVIKFYYFFINVKVRKRNYIYLKCNPFFFVNSVLEKRIIDYFGQIQLWFYFDVATNTLKLCQAIMFSISKIKTMGLSVDSLACDLQGMS